MNGYIFLGIGFILGVLFIVVFSDLIESIIQKEDYRREKWVSAILFGLIIVFIMLFATIK
ncbi:hypothetical protein [Bacillus niameyensis]|uniref:hypothetical protein n=1 Tax=Bacillus niameyensis TaxID=1522308 RepID=UPI000783E478|nr:hypothetical protein [Bacillus niameyensis]